MKYCLKCSGIKPFALIICTLIIIGCQPNSQNNTSESLTPQSKTETTVHSTTTEPVVSGELLYSLNDAPDDNGLVLSYMKLIDSSSGQLTLLAKTNTSKIFLPDLDYTKGKGIKIDIEATYPAKTLCQAFYTTSADAKYTEKQSASIKVPKGLQTFSLVILEKDIQGKIRIDLGNIPGKYILHSLNISAI